MAIWMCINHTIKIVYERKIPIDLSFVDCFIIYNDYVGFKGLVDNFIIILQSSQKKYQQNQNACFNRGYIEDISTASTQKKKAFKAYIG